MMLAQVRANRRARAAVAVAATGCGLLLGCRSELPSPPPPAPVAADALDPVEQPGLEPGIYGWISEVAVEPARFEEVVAQTGREGWIAFHAHDYERAVDLLQDPTARARAEWALFLLHDDLSRLSGFAFERFFSEWDARTGLPEGSAAPAVATLASFCSEQGSLAGWASRAEPGQPGFEVAHAISRGHPPWDVESPDAFSRRLQLHNAARSRGHREPLIKAATQPLLVEPAGKFERTFYDPCVHRTLAETWATQFAQSLGGKDWVASAAFAEGELLGRLFSPWLTASDLKAELRAASHPGVLGAHAPSLRALGVGTTPYPNDDSGGARIEVRLLDVGLDGWRTALLEQVDDDGRALLVDLKLIERFRQEWLVVRARDALLQDRPAEALGYLEAALDASEPGVGPSNSPLLWALLAEARLRVGRAREALDALHVLSGAYPEVVGVKEVTGNLAVLRGLDAQGDSKEE